MAVQPGLCGTWSENPKTGFLTKRATKDFSCKEFSVVACFCLVTGCQLKCNGNCSPTNQGGGGGGGRFTDWFQGILFLVRNHCGAIAASV